MVEDAPLGVVAGPCRDRPDCYRFGSILGPQTLHFRMKWALMRVFYAVGRRTQHPNRLPLVFAGRILPFLVANQTYVGERFHEAHFGKRYTKGE